MAEELRKLIEVEERAGEEDHIGELASAAGEKMQNMSQNPIF